MAAWEVLAPRRALTIGINLFRDSSWEHLDRMRVQPFIGPADSYPINRRPKGEAANWPAHGDRHGAKN
jgi:hypothetical protein